MKPKEPNEPGWVEMPELAATVSKQARQRGLNQHSRSWTKGALRVISSYASNPGEPAGWFVSVSRYGRAPTIESVMDEIRRVFGMQDAKELTVRASAAAARSHRILGLFDHQANGFI